MLKKSLIIFLIAIILLNLTLVIATTKVKFNTSNFFRIHVVANSDNIDDQLLKFKIAKQLEEYISTLTAESISKEDSKKIIEENAQNILNYCNNIITKEGFNYEVKAQLGNLKYEEKKKDNVSMPSGIYDSIKIIIGNGTGNNWWSLIYPSSIGINYTNDITSDEIKYDIFIIDWFKELISKR